METTKCNKDINHLQSLLTCAPIWRKVKQKWATWITGKCIEICSPSMRPMYLCWKWHFYSCERALGWKKQRNYGKLDRCSARWICLQQTKRVNDIYRFDGIVRVAPPILNSSDQTKVQTKQMGTPQRHSSFVRTFCMWLFWLLFLR